MCIISVCAGRTQTEMAESERRIRSARGQHRTQHKNTARHPRLRMAAAAVKELEAVEIGVHVGAVRCDLRPEQLQRDIITGGKGCKEGAPRESEGVGYLDGSPCLLGGGCRKVMSESSECCCGGAAIYDETQ